MEPSNQKETGPSSKPSPKDENSYPKITSVTFELLALNLIILGGGYYFNTKVDTNIPWVLLGSVFFSIAATIYYLLQKFGK